MTNYSKGRRAEWLVRDHYKALGYEVFRMAGSKGVADLIVTRPEGMYVIQVKSGVKPSGKPFRRELEALQVLTHRWPTEDIEALFMWRRRGNEFVVWRAPMGGEYEQYETRLTVGGKDVAVGDCAG